MMPKYLYTIADDYAPDITTTLQNVRFYLMFILSEAFARLLRGTIIALKFCEKCSFTPRKLRFFAKFCLILVPL
jgi:hypothetical protein